MFMNAFFSMRHHFSVRSTAVIVLSCLSFGMTDSAQAQLVLKKRPAAPPSLKSAPTASKAPRPVDAIFVVVNDGVITYQELASRLQQLEKRLIAQGVALPPRAQLQSQLLDRMIVERVQLQMARESGIVADDAMLDRAMSGIAAQNKLSVPDLRMRMERDGISFADFREDIRREIVMQRLREREVDNKVQVTESEVDNYLAAESHAAVRHEDLNLAQILIHVPENAAPKQLAARRQRAEEALSQLKAGADFAQTAMAYSDSSDALRGGELGWRSQDRLPQLFLDAVAALKPGEVSNVIKSGNGFHIIKLIDRRTTSDGKADAPTVEQTHVRHILIKLNQVVSAAEARRKLLELKERLDHQAATFEELARLYSNDLSASKGGDLGWIYPGDTVPEFERAMNELKPGEISQPIESPFGFHLIQVLERKIDDVSQERVRQVVRRAIRERKIDEATEDWLHQLRDRAYVEFRTDDD